MRRMYVKKRNTTIRRNYVKPRNTITFRRKKKNARTTILRVIFYFHFGSTLHSNSTELLRPSSGFLYSSNGNGGLTKALVTNLFVPLLLFFAPFLNLICLLGAIVKSFIQYVLYKREVILLCTRWEIPPSKKTVKKIYSLKIMT